MISFLFFCLFPIIPGSFAASCAGSGTVVLFGNGMFNSRDEATSSKIALEEALLPWWPTLNSKLRFDVSYKRSEPLLEQLVNVAVQKGVSDFENFWTWLSSLSVAPRWFKDAIEERVVTLFGRGTTFPNLKEHFESYARYIRTGYNVILVSHSQGNFYANQAMRNLSAYPDGSLTGSIEKKQRTNSLFPKFSNLFANVQVATPVSATVDTSPWTTFKDDFVMATLRKKVSVLPGNVESLGIGSPPEGDFLGHSFTKAYLRNAESKQKILRDIQSAYIKLKFPIAYYQPAVMLEQEQIEVPAGQSAELHPKIHAIKDGGDLQLRKEERLPSGKVSYKDFVTCFELPPGDTKITARTFLDGPKLQEFRLLAWPEGKVNPDKEKPVELKMLVKGRGWRTWDIGVILAKAGQGREPLNVQVEAYREPRLR